ncbi:MAG: S1/P1 nuclease, partial [Pseudohongiella sp.]|nr:S1/P1 nuclease [Pseudohongiella sp.]
SEPLFPEGDRGGNGTRVNNGNLHSTWDRALREIPVSQSMPALMAIATDISSDTDQLGFRPTYWLQQSRDILLSTVYPQTVIDNVLRSENTGNELGTVTLSAAYEQQMREIATQRIAEAGARIAYTLENL